MSVQQSTQQRVAIMGYLNATQAAERLGKSEKTIRRWIAEGRLHAHHPHGRPNLLAIAEDDIEHLATELTQYEQKQNARSLVERVNQIEQELRNYQLLNGTDYLAIGPVEISLLVNRLDALEQRIAAIEQMLRVETPVPSDTKEITRTAEPPVG
jgi:excisionase family DNA binding protein